LELLREAVGDEAGSYLYEKKAVDKEGNVHYSVEIMEKGPDGKAVNLSGMNFVAGMVASLIQDTVSVATIAVVPSGTKVVGLMGEKGAVGPIGMIGASPGVTSATGSQARVWILDPSQNHGSLPGSVMSNKLPSKLDPAITLAHELGHVAFAWAKMMGPSKAAAVYLENEARKLRDPGGPTRERHEPNEPKVVDVTVQIPVRGLSNWPK
jgi:hypothetical protein